MAERGPAGRLSLFKKVAKPFCVWVIYVMYIFKDVVFPHSNRDTPDSKKNIKTRPRVLFFFRVWERDYHQASYTLGQGYIPSLKMARPPKHFVGATTRPIEIIDPTESCPIEMWVWVWVGSIISIGQVTCPIEMWVWVWVGSIISIGQVTCPIEMWVRIWVRSIISKLIFKITLSVPIDAR